MFWLLLVCDLFECVFVFNVLDDYDGMIVKGGVNIINSSDF